MLGTELLNPLTYFFDGRSDVLMYILAAITAVIMISLMWRGSRRYAGWCGAAVVGMLILGADMGRVLYTEPMDVTVHVGNNLWTIDDYDTTIYATPSLFTLVLSVVFVGAAGVLIFQATKARKLLTLGALVVGFLALVTFATDLSQRFFAPGSGRMQDAFWAVSYQIWSLLFVSLCAYAVLVVVVAIVRGIRRIRNRAQLSMMNPAPTATSSAVR